jgi:peptidoglycan hydrolase CwlO-like protein
MGWFNSVKKEEELSSPIPSFQQDSSFESVVDSSSTSQISQEIGNVSREVSSSGQVNKSEPFFVRVDKLNDAKANLIEIEKKMGDMENVLARLGETKEKEDAEIDSWKQDMKSIRDYLEDINESIFDRL